MARVSSNDIIDRGRLNSPQCHSTDPNQNSSSTCHEKDITPPTVCNSRDANLEVLLRAGQDQERYTQIGIHPPQDGRTKRLWQNDVFIFGEPSSILTVIRFIQLFVVNLAAITLPWMSFVREFVTESSSWAITLSIAAHSLFYVIEEFILYEFPSRRSTLQLQYVILNSVLYAICEVHFCLVSSIVYFNAYVTSSVLFILTIIYLVDHWHSRVKVARQMLQATTIVRFDGVTRPETADIRLNIGPQLVFPVPQEFSMPGDR